MIEPVAYRWDQYGSGRTPGPLREWKVATKGNMTRAFRALKMPQERLRVRFDNGQEVVFRRRGLPPILGIEPWEVRRAEARKTCRIVRADRWKAKPGTTHYFASFNFGLHTSPPLVRLFPNEKSRDFFVRRVGLHGGNRPVATGRVTFKEPRK